MSINSVVLMGKVDSEPAMTYTPNGLAITKFILETPSGSATRPNDKHNITVFGKGNGDDGLAAWAAQFLKPGTNLILQGRLSGNEFTTKENKKFVNSQVVAFTIEALG
jgi:single-strand DNA-binding protein